MTFLLGVPSADAVDLIPPRFLDLDPGRSTQIQGDPCRSEYMAVERPCVPVYVWKEAASTVEHRCWLPFVWMHPVWGMWRITNSVQQNEAARSPACAPAYLEHALERGHTWPPLGVTRGRGKHPGCESQAMGPHHPKSYPLFAQHPDGGALTQRSAISDCALEQRSDRRRRRRSAMARCYACQ